MFELPVIATTEDCLYWAPSKAYYFTDRMWEVARNRLSIEGWTPVMYTRQLNPLTDTLLILPKTEGAVETKVVNDWLGAWATTLAVPSRPYAEASKIQLRLQNCLETIIKSAEENSFHRDQHSLYLLAESCFVPCADTDTEDDEFDDDAAGALYAMIHLWEARVPLTASLLTQFRERIREVCVDPTAGMSDQHVLCGSAATVELRDSNGDKLTSLIDDMRSLSYAQMAGLVRKPHNACQR